MLNNNSKKPIMVQHPETGDFIDVRPFFNFLFEGSFNNNSISAKRESIKNTIRFINLNLKIDEPSESLLQEQANILYSLYNLQH